MRFSPEFIAKLKSSVDLVAIVSETVQLRRSGKQLTGLSPFSKEKSPSFFVNPETQSFMCYSTNQGGDVLTYLEKTKGLSFFEAVSFLAEKAGIELEQSDKTPEQLAAERALHEKKAAALKLNAFAARFYQDQLEGPGGAPARDYIKKRGISGESVLSFALGFAPDSWTSLRDYFLKINAPLIDAFDLGLLRARNNEKPRADGSNLFDTFRNRLLFPIRGVKGEVLGFGGRWLGPAGSDAPKYLNSPESFVYEKEKILYNLDQARKPIRDLDAVVLVEGYMDCLSLVQAGFTNVVANCGTALTRHQVGSLRRLAGRVICLYDSDKAGQAAMEKAMDLFLEAEGLPLLGAQLPDGKDPDEFLRAHGDEGRLRMAEILQNSPALIDDWITKVLSQTPPNLQARTEALNKIASKLSKLRDELAIQARFPGLSRALEFEPGFLIEAVRKFRKTFLPDRGPPLPMRHPGSGTASPGPASRAPFARTLPRPWGGDKQKIGQIQGASGRNDFAFQRRFLCELLRNFTWIEQLRKTPLPDRVELLSPVDDPAVQQALSKILEPLQPQETESERIGALLDSFREQPEFLNLVAEASVSSAGEEGGAALDLETALRRLKDDQLRRRSQELQREIREAEAGGDVQALERLLAELTELRRQRVR